MILTVVQYTVLMILSVEQREFVLKKGWRRNDVVEGVPVHSAQLFVDTLRVGVVLVV